MDLFFSKSIHCVLYAAKIQYIGSTHLMKDLCYVLSEMIAVSIKTINYCTPTSRNGFPCHSWVCKRGKFVFCYVTLTHETVLDAINSLEMYGECAMVATSEWFEASAILLTKMNIFLLRRILRILSISCQTCLLLVFGRP